MLELQDGQNSIAANKSVLKILHDWAHRIEINWMSKGAAFQYRILIAGSQVQTLADRHDYMRVMELKT